MLIESITLHIIIVILKLIFFSGETIILVRNTNELQKLMATGAVHPADPAQSKFFFKKKLDGKYIIP